MVQVRVEPTDEGWVCEVTIDQAGQTTRHTVVVSRADIARWGRSDDAAGVEDLVERSFAFLLEREPPSSILRRFELAVIQHYFPDYDQQFRR
jgi:hypothetical protein